MRSDGAKKKRKEKKKKKKTQLDMRTHERLAQIRLKGKVRM